MTDISRKKQDQRSYSLEKRKQLKDEMAAEFAAGLFFDRIPVGESSAVSLYIPIGSELDTQPLITKLADIEGVRCLLPVIEERDTPLIFRVWKPGQPLVKAGFKTVEPSRDAPEAIPDILVVPLLAFDERGYRMGYGGGFYDRTLAVLRAQKSIQAVGYAYEGQRVEEVVIDEYDQPLDWVVTEKKVRKFR
ncbi:5-formyltetrahydrofolate cyclo-ligase [Sneathiella limimaris]|uniref:5-formyltetrahydrofolate cyclo-ligase n=1 Tax=Sneathiella limimaris TaxID=1964213 RepID=UPI00146A8640|nr:5-formyltetrahydrofolate cyclo-ligase [Sneathiella limimaris]